MNPSWDTDHDDDRTNHLEGGDGLTGDWDGDASDPESLAIPLGRSALLYPWSRFTLFCSGDPAREKERGLTPTGTMPSISHV